MKQRLWVGLNYDCYGEGGLSFREAREEEKKKYLKTECEFLNFCLLNTYINSPIFAKVGVEFFIEFLRLFLGFFSGQFGVVMNACVRVAPRLLVSFCGRRQLLSSDPVAREVGQFQSSTKYPEIT